MTQLIPLECPHCHVKWSMDYAQLQAYQTTYRGADEGVGRLEEYRLRCPNPAHGEFVIVRLRVFDADE